MRGCVKFAFVGIAALWLLHRYPAECQAVIDAVKREILELVDDVRR